MYVCMYMGVPRKSQKLTGRNIAGSSELIYACFNSYCYHPTRTYPRGFAIFSSLVASHSPPQRKRQFTTPGTLKKQTAVFFTKECLRRRLAFLWLLTLSLAFFFLSNSDCINLDKLFSFNQSLKNECR